MANPVILFYNLDNEKGRKLKLICLKHKIKIKVIEKAQYSSAIGALAGLSDLPVPVTPQDVPETDFSDEMIVFHNFDNRLLNTFLLEFKKNSLPRVDLKAVLTEHNRTWNSYHLHNELSTEHEAMTARVKER